MTELRNWLEGMWLVIMLSVLGGMARAAKCGDRSFWGWFCSSLVALFSGVVTHMFLSGLTSIPDTARVALASVSAYSGGVILDAMQSQLASVATAIIGHNKTR